MLVHTGQNYDYALNQVFFDDLGIREPDHYWASTPPLSGHVLGETLIRTEEVLARSSRTPCSCSATPTAASPR